MLVCTALEHEISELYIISVFQNVGVYNNQLTFAYLHSHFSKTRVSEKTVLQSYKSKGKFEHFKQKQTI